MSSRTQPAVPSLAARLLASTSDPREQAAVWALAEEEHLLSLDAVRRTLVHETDDQVKCLWWRLASNVYGLGLIDEERAFVHLVLSMAGVGHQTSLVRVTELEERRLAIILRAMIRLSGCTTLTVHT